MAGPPLHRLRDPHPLACRSHPPRQRALAGHPDLDVQVRIPARRSAAPAASMRPRSTSKRRGWRSGRARGGQAGEGLSRDEPARRVVPLTPHAPCPWLFVMLTQFEHPTQLQLLTWNRRLTGWQIDPWPTSRAEFQRPRVQPPAHPGSLCCLEVPSASGLPASAFPASSCGFAGQHP